MVMEDARRAAAETNLKLEELFLEAVPWRTHPVVGGFGRRLEQVVPVRAAVSDVRGHRERLWGLLDVLGISSDRRLQP